MKAVLITVRMGALPGLRGVVRLVGARVGFTTPAERDLLHRSVQHPSRISPTIILVKANKIVGAGAPVCVAGGKPPGRRRGTTNATAGTRSPCRVRLSAVSSFVDTPRPVKRSPDREGAQVQEPAFVGLPSEAEYAPFRTARHGPGAHRRGDRRVKRWTSTPPPHHSAVIGGLGDSGQWCRAGQMGVGAEPLAHQE